MKKLLISLSVIFIFLGCGKEPVKLTTSEEKRVLIMQVINGEEKAISELKEIKATLIKQKEKGLIEAKTELDEWNSIESFEKNMGSYLTKEADKIKF